MAGSSEVAGSEAGLSEVAGSEVPPTKSDFGKCAGPTARAYCPVAISFLFWDDSLGLVGDSSVWSAINPFPTPGISTFVITSSLTLSQIDY